MNFVRRPRQAVEITLTPLIDVVFLLLIFFMVSTTFIDEADLAIDLPEASEGQAPADAMQIEVAVDATGGMTVNGLALPGPEALASAIDAASGGDASLPFVIIADAATPHQAVVTVMDVAGQLGFARLGIRTRLAGAEQASAEPAEAQ